MGWGGGQQWQEMGARPSRPFDTVVLDEGTSFDGLLLRGILGHLPTASKSKQPHAHFVCRFHAIPMCYRQSNHITISLSRKRFFTLYQKGIAKELKDDVTQFLDSAKWYVVWPTPKKINLLVRKNRTYVDCSDSTVRCIHLFTYTSFYRPREPHMPHIHHN